MNEKNDMPFRFERKYPLPAERAGEFEQFLKLHPESFRTAFPPRWVNSIYLDTLDHAAFHRHVEEASRRVKLRIRWYGDLEGAIERPQLEAKIKMNNRNAKRRAALPDAAFSLGDLPRQVARWLAALPDDEPLKARAAHLRPVTLVRYHRQYHCAGGERCRVTIDTQLCCFGPGPGGADFRRVAVGAGAVVELKHDNDQTGLAAEIVDRFPIRSSRHSKYLKAMRASMPW